MAFVAEDGTGLEDANSLCDVAFADAYFADRVVTAWTGADAVKQGALIRATDYVEGRWALKFKGSEQFPEVQGLSFPRLEIGWDDAVPVGIKRAVAEYALRALANPLAPDPVVDATGAAVKSNKEVVGPIETEVVYQDAGQVVQPFKPYPAADMLVKPFLRSSSGLIR